MRRLLASNKVVPTVEVVIQALAGTAAVTSAGRTGMATATVAATGALSQLTRQTGHFSSLAAVPSLPLTGQHPTGRTLLLRQPLSTTCGAGNASGSASNSGSGRNPGSSRRASSSVDPDNLRSIKGVGPLNEGLLRRKQILTVQDLREIVMDMKDPDALPEYLHSECGIRRLHGKLIAQEILQLVKADATKAAEGGMVTLAVEGNISAGKSTFLDVLSHDDTNLRDELQVVPEPVQQWQAFDCKDRLGRDTTENVLQKFYSDPQRFAYSFQHYVLVSRMAEDRKSRHCGKGLRVVERSIFSDRQVFVRAMHSAGTMEDFEVSVYNTIFDNEVEGDTMLVPDGFVYLRADPKTCMQRMKRRNRGEEGGVSQEYLDVLHANHEDWLSQGMTMKDLLQRLGPRQRATDNANHANSAYGSSLYGGASVLAPASEAAVQSFVQSCTPGVMLDSWKLELIENVPEAIKDQVLLLKGTDGLPQLQHRLALVMDHDTDVDIHRDISARLAYAAKIKTFYDFVKQWKQRETEAAESLKCGVRGAWEGGGTFNVDGYGNVTVKLGKQVGQAPGLTI